MTAFANVCPDTAADLDVHPAPEGDWARVVVVGLWTSAEVLRKRWPHAAAVGPLRSLRGIDWLLRNLLANPQVRMVLVTGPDLSDGAVVEPALQALWQQGSAWGELAEDLQGHADAIVAGVRLAPLPRGKLEANAELGALLSEYPSEDRAGGAIILPPPPPPKVETFPVGDPGQRVVGATLAEVWPRALEQAMRFGRKVQAGSVETREVIALTSVIRDPAATLLDLQGAWYAHAGEGDPRANDLGDGSVHPVLRLTWSGVQAYYRQLVGLDPPPEGQEYSYGSRMAGDLAHWAVWLDHRKSIRHARDLGVGAYAELERLVAAIGIDVVRLREHPDQIAAISALLDKAPLTRAAFLTPWRPGEDSSKESGRPCLVGVWFRAVPNPGDLAYALHMVAAFRSHDLFKGYPKNLAGLCLWLVEEAQKHGMAVGTLTVHSDSAHVYASDYADALEVIEAHPAPILEMDPRSNWRVFLRPGEPVPATCDALVSADGAYPCSWADQARLCGAPATARFRSARTSTWSRCAAHGFTDPDIQRMSLPVRLTLVAEALDPVDPNRVLGAWASEEGPGPLALQVQRTGLLTTIGHALWFGRELERVWAERAGATDQPPGTGRGSS